MSITHSWNDNKLIEIETAHFNTNHPDFVGSADSFLNLFSGKSDEFLNVAWGSLA